MHNATSGIAKLLMNDNPGWLDRALLCSRCILDCLIQTYVHPYMFVCMDGYVHMYIYAAAFAQFLTFNRQVFVSLTSTEF